MLYKKFNIWYLNSFLISAIVAIPIVTVFSSFFESTGKYSVIIKDTFLFDYIYSSALLLSGVLAFTSIAMMVYPAIYGALLALTNSYGVGFALAAIPALFSAFVFFYPAFNGSWIARFLYGGLWLIKPRQLCIILFGWLLSASVIGIYVYKNLI